MFTNVGHFLIETAFSLLAWLGLARVWMNAVRLSFHNPLGEFVIALTDWGVSPLRRVVPVARRVDLASLAFAWLAELVKLIVLVGLFAGGIASALGLALLVHSILDLLRAALHVVIFIVIVQVIISWVNPHAPLAFVFDALTRPLYVLFRRVVPPIRNVDLSPLFVVVIAQVLLIVLDGVPRVLLTSVAGG